MGRKKPNSAPSGLSEGGKTGKGKGYKQDGFKELSWMKSDLDFYLDTYSNNK